MNETERFFAVTPEDIKSISSAVARSLESMREQLSKIRVRDTALRRADWTPEQTSRWLSRVAYSEKQKAESHLRRESTRIKKELGL